MKASSIVKSILRGFTISDLQANQIDDLLVTQEENIVRPKPEPDPVTVKQTEQKLFKQPSMRQLSTFEERFRQHVHSGARAWTISKSMGMSESEVYRMAKRLNLRMTKGAKTVSSFKINRILALATVGTDIRDIATEINISPCTIRKIFNGTHKVMDAAQVRKASRILFDNYDILEVIEEVA